MQNDYYSGGLRDAPEILVFSRMPLTFSCFFNALVEITSDLAVVGKV
jgi:hypothetical protein